MDSRIGAFEITKWVTDPEEDAIDKLANFYQVFSKENTSLSESASVSSTATKGLTVGSGISSGVGTGVRAEVNAVVAKGDVNVHTHVDIHAHADGHWDSTMTEMKGVDLGKGETLTHTNYDVKYALDLLEKTMKRLEQCKATGMWNYATYVISQDEPMANN